MFQVAPIPSCPGMVFGKKRDGDIEVGPKVLSTDARLGQHGKANVEAEVFCVVWPGAGIQVEDDVVLTPIPQRKTLNFCSQIVHILRRELVPVQRVQTQDEETSLCWVMRIEPGPLDGGQNVLITLGYLLSLLLGVDVNFKAIPLTQGEIKTGHHPAAFARVNARDSVPLLPWR